MVLDWRIGLTNLTLPVATLICTTWALVTGYGYESVFLFLGGMLFTIIIKAIDHDFYMEKRRYG